MLAIERSKGSDCPKMLSTDEFGEDVREEQDKESELFGEVDEVDLSLDRKLIFSTDRTCRGLTGKKEGYSAAPCLIWSKLAPV